MTAKRPFSATGQVWLSRNGENILDESRMALLEKIAETGSITRAGKSVGISYRTAWLTVDHMNGLADRPLVERTTGGKSGGGTRLTPHGESLLKAYRAIQEEHRKYLERLREGIEDFDRFLHLTRKISLKTSARNQLFGLVESIRKDALNAVITLRLKGKEKIVSQITVAGLESLGLRKGDEAYALIKANWISLAPIRGGRKPGPMPKSGNALTGILSSLKTGDDHAEAVVLLPGGNNLVATLSGRALKNARLAEGMQVLASFQASDVILGIAR